MLIDYLNKIVKENPEKIAIEFEDHKVTYSKFKSIINKVVNGLVKLGVKKGDRIALIMPNTPHFIFAYYAILKLGAIAVPVNFLSKDSELITVFKKTIPSTVIIWEGFYTKLSKNKILCDNIIVLGKKNIPETISFTKMISDSQDDEHFFDITQDDTALICYILDGNNTKFIELTHNNLSSIVSSCFDIFSSNSTNIYAGLMPLFNIIGQNFIMNCALCTGAKLVLYQKLNIDNVNRLLNEDKITHLITNSGILRFILNNSYNHKDNHRLKYILSIGNLLNENLKSSFENKMNIIVYEGYGTLETSGLISINREKPDHKDGSVGIPIDGVKIKIVNENGEELEKNDIGEIVISGDNIMKGYWEQHQRTNKWFNTGDIGRIDEDGFLYFLNKKEDVILKSGFCIYPSEIEQILLKHPKIDQVVVVGVPDPNFNQEVKACIKLINNETTTPEEIIKYCKEYVPVYKCPQIIKFYNSFPKTSTGKILKRKLRESL